jgi:hypothetical protein
MSVTGGPVRIANSDPEAWTAQARLADTTARRRTGEFARITRHGRLRRAAHRMIWGGSEAAAVDGHVNTEPGRPWSTGREILAEIVLPLLGLAVVIGIAAFLPKL